MHQSVMPCALEFMDHRAIDAIRPTGAADDLPPGTRALLMVEADGAVAGFAAPDCRTGSRRSPATACSKCAAVSARRHRPAVDRTQIAVACRQAHRAAQDQRGRGGAGFAAGRLCRLHRPHRQHASAGRGLVRPCRQRQPARQPHGAPRRRRRNGSRPPCARRHHAARPGAGRHPLGRTRHRHRKAPLHRRRKSIPPRSTSCARSSSNSIRSACSTPANFFPIKCRREGFTSAKGIYRMRGFVGGIAQLGERLHGMQEVSGSIPLTSTN